MLARDNVPCCLRIAVRRLKKVIMTLPKLSALHNRGARAAQPKEAEFINIEVGARIKQMRKVLGLSQPGLD